MPNHTVPWPNGARCAASITFDMDSDSILHLAHDDAYKRVSTISWLRYDEVAVPRIVQMLDRFGIKGTFFVPAWCIERYPATVQHIVDSGHELAHHGYLHEQPMDQSPEGERYWLRRCIEVFKRFSGKKPVGSRSPYYSFSPVTTSLLVQEGFIYDSSLMADSQPYLLGAPEGKVIELPSDWPMDDWPHYTHAPDFSYLMPISAPDKAMEVYMAELDAAYDLGGLWVTVWHPFVSGRPARLARVARMIEEQLKRGGVWFASMEQIARHVQQCVDNRSFTPRTVPMPYYEKPIAELTEGAPAGLAIKRPTGWGSSS
jgi:peptidoglycan/xylan/chitin deacetylase (PgdA/CDA1 family)